MRLAISHIAWSSEQETAIADRLVEWGAEGVEVAPTRIWPHPLEATDGDIRAYRRFWEQRGLPIVAMQALLFEKPALRIFANEAQRHETLAYLEGILRLAGKLGVESLVFGSPKNRTIGAMPPGSAQRIALDFFRKLGDIAQANGTTLCIEPNPRCYACDFLTTAVDGLEFVRRVDHPNIGLHLDAAALHLAQDPAAGVFRVALPIWRHFHISEPYLGIVGEGMIDHGALAAALRGCGYDRWISIEMKPAENGNHARNVENALRFVRRGYLQDRGAAPTTQVA